MKRLKNLNFSLRVFAAVVIVAIMLTSLVYAITLISSGVRAQVDVSTGSLAETEITADISVQSEAVQFDSPGDTVKIPLAFNSNITDKNKIISYYYGLSCEGLAASSSEEGELAASDLAAAVFAYYNGEYLGTLSALCSDGEYTTAPDFLFPASTDENNFTFELHIGAPEALFADRTLNVKITCYMRTADYASYIFVKDENDFARAADDINSGLLADDVTVVLGGDVALTSDYTLTQPSIIDLHGNALTFSGGSITLSQSGTVKLVSTRAPASVSEGVGGGESAEGSGAESGESAEGVGGGYIVLKGAEALLDIADFDNSSSYAAMVTAIEYDHDGAKALLSGRIAENLSLGVKSGETVNAYSSLVFYVSSASVTDGCSLSGGMLTACANNATVVATLTVNGDSYSIAVPFKVIGSAENVVDSLLQNELKHIPYYSEDQLGTSEAVTGNLFLPKSVESKNITITWISGDEEIISSEGRLADSIPDNSVVTLYALIRANDQNYSTSFTFKVSSQNNEQKFSYLVTQLSPVTLNAVGEGGCVYLPIVDPSSSYDYRKPFGESPNYWAGFSEIGLSEISYTVDNTYNYVTLNKSGSCSVYLNTPVFYTFAQLNVSGKFIGDDNVYSGVVNVIIALGDNTELDELVFNYVDSELNKIDILQNILSTRYESGMANERGDFYMPAAYMTYEISYSIPESDLSGMISEISSAQTTDEGGNVTDSYLVAVNPANFSITESSAAILVTIKNTTVMLENYTGNSRVQYFVTPAVIKPDEYGFKNLSVFYSAKYQVFNQLPDGDFKDARTVNSGFTLSEDGKTVTCQTGAYILMRDAEYCKSLEFILSPENGASTSNAEVYDFMRLLEWATGNGTVTAESIVAGCGNTTSDGKEYLTDSEIAVLKAYYQSKTEISDESWNALWASVSQRAPGKIVVDGATLNSTVNTLLRNLYTSNSEQVAYYFKHVELMQWATNEKDYGVSAGGQYAGSPPNLGAIGDYVWTDVDSVKSTSTPSKQNGIDYIGYTKSPYYDNEIYQEDETEYISAIEEELIKVFWLNISYGKSKLADGVTFVSTFNSCTVVPTYLNSDGAGILCRALYSDLGYGAGSGYTFTSGITGNAPHVTNMDGSLTALEYFKGLTSLKINGSQKLSAFLTTSAISSAFNRITTYNTALTSLTMSYCANNYVEFDLTNTQRLAELTSIDFSNNYGVNNVSVLVNPNMANYKYLDIYNVNVSYEFEEYALSNIYYAGKGQVYYADEYSGLRVPYTSDKDVNKSLTYLKEIGAITSVYLQLPQQIYTTSTSSDVIYWRIEQGNMMTLVTSAGELSTFNSYEDFANYYYVYSNVAVGDKTLTANHIYKISYENNALSFKDVGEVTAVSSLPTALSEDDIQGAVSVADYTETVQGSSTASYGTTSTSTTTSYSQTFTSNTYTPQLTINYIDSEGNEQSTTITAYSVGYGMVTKTVKTVYRDYTYTSANQATQAVTYFYTGDTATVLLVNGEQVTISKNSCVKCEYIYRTANTSYIEYTVTQTIEMRDYFFKTSTQNNSTANYLRTYSNGIYENWTSLNYTYYTRSQSGWNPTYTKNEVTIEPNLTITSTSDDKASATTVNMGTQTVNGLNSVQTYIYPVKTIAGTDDINAVVALATDAATGNAYYQYTGTTQTIDCYNESVTPVQVPLTQNAYYLLTIDGDGFKLTQTTAVSQPAADTLNMDAILADANSHVNDGEYGNYYGMYYYYSGPTAITKAGNFYEKDGVYRLLTDKSEDGTFYFYFEKTDITCQTCTSVDNMLMITLADNAEELIGTIYYLDDTSSADSRTYENNLFYILTRNESTGAYYMKRFGAVNAELCFASTSAEATSSRLVNERYYSGANYGGTGGTETAVITAIVRDEDGTEYLRKFEVTVKG